MTQDQLDRSGRPASAARDVAVAKEPAAPALETPVTVPRPAFGWPPGSVRAMLTLIIVAVVVWETARGVALSAFWLETLMIALAHYFTSRRLLDLPPSAVQRLEQEGLLEREEQPLWLPRHSVRLAVFAAFLGLAVYLHQHQRLFAEPGASLLLIVAAYFLGMITRPFVQWLRRRFGAGGWTWWTDVKALSVLATLFLAAAARMAGREDLLPAGTENLALAMALFYYGSR